MSVEIVKANDQADLVTQLINNLTDYISTQVQATKEVHIALTGGRIGTEISKQLLANPVIDSPLVHIWWSDERFVSKTETERNDSVIPINFAFRTKLHPLPASDQGLDLTAAVAKAENDLHLSTTSRFCARNVLMDITLLSVGPDGHVASLFPNHSALTSTAGIVGIADSPKPPAQRLTWTLPTINASEQVWLIASGSEKTIAVEKLLNESTSQEIPAGKVNGLNRTVLYVEAELLTA